MKRWLIIGVALATLLTFSVVQHSRVVQLKKDYAAKAENVETLLSDAEQYSTRDSLNAATINALRLTVEEYERYRAADAELIKTLKTKNRDLAAITTSQSETIVALSAVPHDTVVVRDSIAVEAITVHSGDAWYDFDGLLTKDSFTGEIAIRDSLLIAQTVKYKRFLWWKTKQVKNCKLDIVSKNPYTKITGFEFVTIER